MYDPRNEQVGHAKSAARLEANHTLPLMALLDQLEKQAHEVRAESGGLVETFDPQPTKPGNAVDSPVSGTATPPGLRIARVIEVLEQTDRNLKRLRASVIG